MAKNKFVAVVNRATGETLIPQARLCQTHFSRFRGLQLHRPLKPGEAIILSKTKDSISSSSIHMFFVFFPIAAVWINGQGRVTSAQLAKPWRPMYRSPEPARYVLETTPDFLKCISVGDQLDFVG